MSPMNIWSQLRPTPKHNLPAELYHFALLAPDDESAPDLWDEVEERVNALPPIGARRDRSLRYGMLGGAIAALLTITLVSQIPTSPPDLTIRARMDFDGQGYKLANAQENPRRLLDFQVGRVRAPSGRNFQIWYVPKDGAAPLSLGLAPDAAIPARYDLPKSALPDGLIAISEEAFGGSQSGAPEGPIVAMAPIALFF